jgi:hypothetical protein
MCSFDELQATPYKAECNWVNVHTRFVLQLQELRSVQTSVLVAILKFELNLQYGKITRRASNPR